MRANYKAVSDVPYKSCTVIEVCNYPTMNGVINIPRVSKAEFLTQEDRRKEEFIKGYWKVKQLKK